MKILEQNERYSMVQWDYEDMPITVRFWKDSDIVEIRVDEYFARANGYKSVDDMAVKTIGKTKFNELFGGIPDWIRASPNGIFTFVGVNRTMLN